jgi:hypothetical protein
VSHNLPSCCPVSAQDRPRAELNILSTHALWRGADSVLVYLFTVMPLPDQVGRQHGRCDSVRVRVQRGSEGLGSCSSLMWPNGCGGVPKGCNRASWNGLFSIESRGEGLLYSTVMMCVLYVLYKSKVGKLMGAHVSIICVAQTGRGWST